jgi:hypothetical protein
MEPKIEKLVGVLRKMADSIESGEISSVEFRFTPRSERIESGVMSQVIYTDLYDSVEMTFYDPSGAIRKHLGV